MISSREHPGSAGSGSAALIERLSGRRIPACEAVGVTGLYLLAFFQIANKTMSWVGLVLMLLAAIADGRRFGSALARSPVAWATLTLGVYVALRAVAGAWQQPALAGADYHSLTDWLLLPFLFPLIAWYSRGASRRIRWVLVVALVGTLLGMALRANWPSIAQEWATWHRARWGLTYICAALYLGSALIGWVAFAGRLMRPDRHRWLRAAVWLAVAAILGEMLFLTQSRSVLLSLVVILPAIALTKLWRTADPTARRHGMVMAAAVLIGVVALALANRGPIVARFHKTAETVQGMSTLELHKIPETSLGQRVRLYRFGGRMWLEHPLWGWGPGFEAAMMRPDAPLKPGTRRHYPHLHDGYLETLVRFGVVGFALTGLLAFFLVRGLWRAWRRGDVPVDVGLFLVGAGMLAALTNLTDFRLVYKPYAFYTILLLGLIYGYSLKSMRSHPESPSDRPGAASVDG